MIIPTSFALIFLFPLCQISVNLAQKEVIYQQNKINHNYMQLQPNQNPQNYIDNSITYSGMIRKNDRLSNKQNLFEQCRSILQKPHENRIPSDNHTLLRLVEKSQLLKELSDLFGIDFIKGILRNSKLQTIDERQVVAQEDQSIKYMVIVIQGKLGVEKSSIGVSQDNQIPTNQEDQENLSLKTDELFDKMTILAKKERDQLRKTLKLKRKNTIPTSDYQFYLPVLSQNDYTAVHANIERTILMNEQYGGKERLNGRFYKNRVISLQRTTLFIIQISFLFYWLEVAFKNKLSKNIEKMKTIHAFEILQNEKLAEIIISMKLMKKSKNSIIYSQGDNADMIYLLADGQLKMSKQADLFKENPNDLYVDRRRLMQQQKFNKKSLSKSLRNSQDDVLPFANLTTLYNYRPVKKTIDMGLISSFGLFGEEEVVLKIPRETTIQVSSIDASYYQIEFKKILEIIGNKNVDRFKEVLENSISKKVLYRQSEFAQQIHFQNKNNMNYFYLEEGKTQESPIKVKLQKINQKVAPKSARETIDHAPPFYTTFNFNKMLSKRYSTIDKKQENRSTINDSSQKIPPLEFEYNIAEQKMVDFSHSWDPIEKKVMQQNIISRRISPFKHQININQPLIDQNFLTNVAKQHRRINKQFRNIRFSLGKRIK